MNQEITSSQNSLQNLGEILHESLQDLIGLHKQLLEVVKQEADAITSADVKNTFEATSSKEALVHWIARSEQNRQVIAHSIAEQTKLENPSLRQIIAYYQIDYPTLSQQLQTDLSALLVLADRIKLQNKSNGDLVERSLKHVSNMRKNIFGDVPSENKTYNQQGQKTQASPGSAGPRMISKEV